MLRNKRSPAPSFRMPGQPFNPATGENATLQNYPSKGTTLALFQVVEEDTHDNYVVCRGYEADSDPEFRYLHDPYTVPTTTPINVAKPYSARGTNTYVEGQIILAGRIKGKLGFNPGKAATTVGQPADLDEEIELLLDDDDVAISWMDVAGTPSSNHNDYALATIVDVIAACDWADLLDPVTPTEFSEGAASVYVPVLKDNDKYAYEVLSGGAKRILNFLPFDTIADTTYYLTYINGDWIVKRPWEDGICFRAAPSSGTLSATKVQWIGANFGGKVANLDTVVAATIKFKATLHCRFQVTVALEGSTAPDAWDSYVAMYLSGGASPIAESYFRQAISGSTAVASTVRHTHTLIRDYRLSEGDYIEIQVTNSYGGTLAVLNGEMTITPMIQQP